ncbi:hypothetical protein PUN28_006506 [Cardiocondyla obscurior]|uniref:Uncharacterized protein n=1 Tax=Cardiocondyla obscurior TaxID=286306 RepID=A0AAW2GAY1_9HYME
MWPGSLVLFVVNALIPLVHSLPSNIDWNTAHNDSDSIAQNERTLKLFLQLATSAANRLSYLREADKKYDCNSRDNNPPISTTEDAVATQSPSQTDLEWPDKSQEIQKKLSPADFDINPDRNQTALYSQLQKLFDTFNLRNTDEENTMRKQKLDNEIGLIKNITNTSSINELTRTANKFFTKPRDQQESTSGISQRLFGLDLPQAVPKFISDVRENVNQHIPSEITQHTRELSDKIGNVNQGLLEPVVKNTAIIPRAANNFSVANQILSDTKNIMESMIQVLPEAAKGATSLLNKIIPQSQDVIKNPLKVAEEGQKYLAHLNHVRQEHLASNAEGNIRKTAGAFGGNDQEATDFLINVGNLTKDSSAPLPRLFLDFNKNERNDSEIRTGHDYDRLTSITEDLSQGIKESESTGVTFATSASPDQLESSAFTLIVTSTEHQAKTFGDAENSEDTRDKLKSNLEEATRLGDNSSAGNGMNQSRENHERDYMHGQLSEAKLQEISDRLINALWPIIRKRIDNNRNLASDRYNEQLNKDFPSNIASNFGRAINGQDLNYTVSTKVKLDIKA